MPRPFQPSALNARSEPNLGLLDESPLSGDHVNSQTQVSIVSDITGDTYGPLSHPACVLWMQFFEKAPPQWFICLKPRFK